MVRVLDRFREVESPILEAALRLPEEAGVGRGDENSTLQAEFLAVPGLYRLEIVDGAGRLCVSQEIGIDEGPADVQTVDVALASACQKTRESLISRGFGSVSVG